MTMMMMMVMRRRRRRRRIMLLKVMVVVKMTSYVTPAQQPKLYQAPYIKCFGAEGDNVGAFSIYQKISEIPVGM